MVDKRQVYKRTTRGSGRNVTAREYCTIHGLWEG
ncbi:MAG: desulfoferrodoxin family protein, partial [Planctomycetota bacterium]